MIIAPVLGTIPADITIDCNDGLPTPAIVTATDLCDDSVEVTSTDEQLPGECGVIRTWTATDDCGNTAVASQTIHLTDDILPVLTGIPANITIECGTPIPAPGQPTATDNCDNEVEITYSEQQQAQGCGYIIVRRWTATDNCDNSKSGVQVITVTDTTDPVLAGVPADITVNSLPGVPNVTATDNCDPEVTITYDETSVQDGCSLVVTRTWTATDDCGNSASASQVITVPGNISFTEIVTPDNCDSGDGTAILSPASLTYNWSDGGTGANRTDLSAGLYTVTATANGCTTVQTVIIPAECDCVEPVITGGTVAEATCLEANGAATVNVAGNPADYDYIWSPDTGTPNAAGNSRTNLPAGVYTVTIINPDFANCTTQTTITVGSNNDDCCDSFIAATSVIELAPDCNSNATVCIEIPLAEISGYTITDNDVAYSGGFTACALGTNLSLPVGVHLLIFTHEALGCSDTLEVKVVCTPDDCDFIAEEALTVTYDCSQSQAEVCINIPLEDILDYEVSVNGSLIQKTSWVVISTAPLPIPTLQYQVLATVVHMH
jgi:hypothetical protein